MHRIVQAAVVARPAKIANHNVHSIYLTKKEPDLMAFFDRTDLMEIDPTS